MDKAEPIYQFPPTDSPKAGPSRRDLAGIAGLSLFAAFWTTLMLNLWTFGILGFLVLLMVFLPLLYLAGGYSSRCPSCGVFWAKNLLREIQLRENVYLQYLQCKLCAHEWEKTVTKGGDGCGCG